MEFSIDTMTITQTNRITKGISEQYKSSIIDLILNFAYLHVILNDFFHESKKQKTIK
jgi:hypothetical protein